LWGLGFLGVRPIPSAPPAPIWPTPSWESLAHAMPHSESVFIRRRCYCVCDALPAPGLAYAPRPELFGGYRSLIGLSLFSIVWVYQKSIVLLFLITRIHLLVIPLWLQTGVVEIMRHGPRSDHGPVPPGIISSIWSTSPARFIKFGVSLEEFFFVSVQRMVSPPALIPSTSNLSRRSGVRCLVPGPSPLLYRLLTVHKNVHAAASLERPIL